MDVLSIIAVIFAENLIAILSLAAFAFLLREYRVRKQRHLLVFALTFFGYFLANIMLYVGQSLHVYGMERVAGVLVRAPQLVVIAVSLLLFWVIIDLYSGKQRPFWMIFAPALPLVSAYFFLTAPSTIVEFHGLAFHGLDMPSYFGIFGAWLVTCLMLMALPKLAAVSAAKSHHGRQPEKLLFGAGLCGVLFFASVIAARIIDTDVLYYVHQSFLLLHLLLLFFAAAAVDHPDAQFKERPTTVLTRNLTLKAAGLNAVLFWVLAFALLALTANYFVNSAIDARKEGLRRDVHFFSRSYSGYGSLFLEETLRLAMEPALVDLASGSMLPEKVREYIDRGEGGRILRVVDADGKILFSSFSSSEIGTYIPFSSVVSKALGGQPVAATEREQAGQFWSIRAAAPFALQDGTFGGVVFGTEARPAFDFTDYTAVAQISADGYGFITEAGETVFSWGRQIDKLTERAFKKALNGRSVVSAETAEGTYFAVERVRATDGVNDGWFYIFLTRATLSTQILRILSLVSFMLVLALAAMTAILIFSAAFVLRPIHELRAAARRIEEGEYDARVTYASPDELGDLAAAFNQMGETIGDRTRSLKAALEEERDFLMHTAMEMRSPLNVFRWTIEMMRFGDTGRLTKEQLELLEQMHQTTRRLISFSQNLLDASLLEQGKISLKKEQVALEDVIDEVAGEYSIKLREKDVNLHWNRPDKPLPAVSGDRERVKQVLMNLVGNAVKYVRESGHVEIVISESTTAGPGGKHGKFVKVTVEDNGRGIPKEEAVRVFQPFYRGKNVVKDDIQGIGLGLFITRELVELHGGKIWYKSEKDGGTTFTFTLPLERTPRRTQEK